MAGKLTGFLRGLVGGGGEDSAPAPSASAVDYKGYSIRPASRKEGAQWLTVGFIVKEFEGGPKEHHFVRADVHPSKDVADDCAVTKAMRIIDERGDKMFEEG